MCNENVDDNHNIIAYGDGFHGHSYEHYGGYLDHEAVLLVAGGIGITLLICALRELVISSRSTDSPTNK